MQGSVLGSRALGREWSNSCLFFLFFFLISYKNNPSAFAMALGDLAWVLLGPVQPSSFCFLFLHWLFHAAGAASACSSAPSRTSSPWGRENGKWLILMWRACKIRSLLSHLCSRKDFKFCL